MSISEVIDDRGYTLLHEACFNNCEDVAKLIVKQAKDSLSKE